MKLFKRTVAILLASLMAFAEPIVTLADSVEEARDIGGTRLEDVPEGNYVYMGNVSVQISEGNGLFSMPIYREGDLSERASVTLHVIDVNAVYGEDYRAVGSDREENLDGRNLLQLAAESSSEESSEEGDADTDMDEYGEQEPEDEDEVATPSEYDDEEDTDEAKPIKPAVKMVRAEADSPASSEDESEGADEKPVNNPESADERPADTFEGTDEKPADTSEISEENTADILDT